MSFKVKNPPLGPGLPGDVVTLYYNGKFRCGPIERCERTHLVVHTEEGYRSFTWGKIENMEIVEFATR